MESMQLVCIVDNEVNRTSLWTRVSGFEKHLNRSEIHACEGGWIAFRECQPETQLRRVEIHRGAYVPDGPGWRGISRIGSPDASACSKCGVRHPGPFRSQDMASSVPVSNLGARRLRQSRDVFIVEDDPREIHGVLIVTHVARFIAAAESRRNRA
jgi:hypothetical protein